MYRYDDITKGIYLKIIVYILFVYTTGNLIHDFQHLFFLKTVSHGIYYFNILNALLFISYFLIKKNYIESGVHLILTVFSLSLVGIYYMEPELLLHNNMIIAFPVFLSIFLARKRFTVLYIIFNLIIILKFKMFHYEFSDFMSLIVILAIFTMVTGLSFYIKDLVVRLEAEKHRQSREIYQSTLRVLGKISEIRDHETSNHLERVAIIVEMLLIRLKKMSKYSRYITDMYISDCIKASTLHDIGKIGIPDKILLKPGKLTDIEFNEIKKHSDIGADILENARKEINGRNLFDMAVDIARYHHEKWDGSGYPKGLKGNEIPFSARIMAIADVYDALISDRPYKKKMSHEEAVGIIKAGTGIHFDPDIAKSFHHVQKEIYRQTHHLAQ